MDRMQFMFKVATGDRSIDMLRTLVRMYKQAQAPNEQVWSPLQVVQRAKGQSNAPKEQASAQTAQQPAAPATPPATPAATADAAKAQAPDSRAAAAKAVADRIAAESEQARKDHNVAGPALRNAAIAAGATEVVASPIVSYAMNQRNMRRADAAAKQTPIYGAVEGSSEHDFQQLLKGRNPWRKGTLFDDLLGQPENSTWLPRVKEGNGYSKTITPNKLKADWNKMYAKWQADVAAGKVKPWSGRVQKYTIPSAIFVGAGTGGATALNERSKANGEAAAVYNQGMDNLRKTLGDVEQIPDMDEDLLNEFRRLAQ